MVRSEQSRAGEATGSVGPGVLVHEVRSRGQPAFPGMCLRGLEFPGSGRRPS